MASSLESMPIRRPQGCIFRSHHPETRFQKSAFSGDAFSESVWTVSQNDEIRVRFRKRVLSSGQGLTFTNCPETWHHIHFKFLCFFYTNRQMLANMFTTVEWRHYVPCGQKRKKSHNSRMRTQTGKSKLVSWWGMFYFVANHKMFMVVDAQV